jgi:STAM-binding protein
MTTTSPAPHAFPIRYPSLMSLHQRSQGYKPSVLSMFQPEHDQPPLVPDPSFGMVYNHTPPQPSEFGTPQSYRTVGDRVIPSPPEDIRAPWPGPGSWGSSGSTAAGSNSPGTGPLNGLRTVALPKECLTRFISIAALNTGRNLETCGLLLGKSRGSKYVVTTLLVPKQRATADTCAMEEEELVMEFTEGRGLITLGWIHTHPTQSCFMSSLDLHTHAGFQRMLPESFAVVCAPQHTPKYVFLGSDPF